uniref:DNA-directed DNA polymerase n=1 Tax=Ditylenchus dipsaci TaxID=166011 RepID=A0A915EIY5_9BILA
MKSLWMRTPAPIQLYRLDHRSCSNVVVQALRQVESTPGACVAYMDTDSIIYKYRTADGNPLQIGKHLGEMTDEYPEHIIEEVVSAGCKQYAMKLRRCDTGQIEHTLKIRGLPMDYETPQSLSYDVFKSKVLSSGQQQQEPSLLNYNQIRGDKFGGVYTDRTHKPIVQSRKRDSQQESCCSTIWLSLIMCLLFLTAIKQLCKKRISLLHLNTIILKAR